MSLSYSYSILFREYQFFATEESSDGWNASGLNYAKSLYGNKVVIVDTKNSLMYVTSLKTDPTNLSKLDALVSSVKTDIAANSVSLTTKTFESMLSGATGYWNAIDLKKDAIYSQALKTDADFNSDVSNIAVWSSVLADGANALLVTGKYSTAYGASGVLSNNSRVYVYETDGGTDQNESINFSKSAEASGTVDGGDGTTDGVYVSSGLEALIASSQKTGVTVDLDRSAGSFSLAVTGKTLQWTLKNIEEAGGTAKNDTLTGTSDRDLFQPGLGDDVVDGKNSGAIGKHNTASLSTKDRVSYWNLDDVSKGITAVASVGKNSSGNTVPVMSVTDSGGGKDTLTDISYVLGTMAADTFTGNSATYQTEFAGLMGADVFTPGSVFTRVSYYFDPNGVTVNLSGSSIKNMAGMTVASLTALDGFGTVDSFKGVNNYLGIRFSEYSDYFLGGTTNNFASGGLGADYLAGGRGNDALWGSSTDVGGLADDTIIGGRGVDLLVGDTYTSDSRTSGADTFIFESLADASGDNKIKDSAGNRIGDVILDLEIAYDLIDLTKIDAKASARGNQEFIAPTGSTFTKVAGELIVQDTSLTLSRNSSNDQFYWWAYDFKLSSSDSVASNGSSTLNGVTLMGDIHGDGRADFSIFLVGVTSSQLLNSTDWIAL